jgi:ATP-dependent helicase/nuclease subunit A
MTRAEEALVIGGALGKRETEPAADSWYARLAALMDGEALDDPIWGMRKEWGSLRPVVSEATPSQEDSGVSLPQWATSPVGPEPRPPRPLAPSAAGAERGSDPPLPPDAVRIAARRGVIVHRLLERLPDVPAQERSDAARSWLARQAPDMEVADREEMAASAIAVLGGRDFAHVFAPGALAEVPLAATVGGQVIAGTADRLLVEPHRVTVVDFKTARRPPASLAEVPEATLRQMAAYAAALAAIYPGREVRAALLYTQVPRLIEVPSAMLDDRKALLSGKSESFPPAPVE